MNSLKKVLSMWRSRSITTKFGLAFVAQLLLLILMAAVSMSALQVIRQEAGATIFLSTHIQHLVLEMDRHLEKSRRLERDFFLRYPQIGFSAAYHQYAQPAEKEVDLVRGFRVELQTFLTQSAISEAWREQKNTLTLYLSAVERHAVTIEEAAVLTGRLSDGPNSVQAQLNDHSSQLSFLLQDVAEPAFRSMFREMHAFEKDYVISRQRPLMQSAFNVAFTLKLAIEKTAALNISQKKQAFRLLEQYQATAEEMLDLNVSIQSLFNEFDLQARAIDPVADALVDQAHHEIERVREQVKQTSAAAIFLLAMTVVLGFGLTGVVAFTLNKSVTHKIVSLTQEIEELQAGHLDAHAQIESNDELVRLADGFHVMATRIDELVGGLEEKVAERTISITIANRQLKQEMLERQRIEDELKRYSERLEVMVDERTQELRQAQNDLIHREKLATLGQLAGGVAHELRHPLGVLSNAAYFLSMTLPDADAKTEEYLTIIAGEIRKSQNIISALLNFAGSKPASPEKTDVLPLIGQILKERPAPGAIQVSTELAPDLSPLYVDPVHLELVLGNLLKNAYQAMPDGGVLLIRAYEDQQSVRLSFADTGVGISEECRKKLFEPLFTTKMRGIGLGLAISRNLIEANGGGIEVESEVGKGTTFTVVLPISPCRTEGV